MGFLSRFGRDRQLPDLATATIRRHRDVWSVNWMGVNPGDLRPTESLDDLIAECDAAIKAMYFGNERGSSARLQYLICPAQSGTNVGAIFEITGEPGGLTARDSNPESTAEVHGSTAEEIVALLGTHLPNGSLQVLLWRKDVASL